LLVGVSLACQPRLSNSSHDQFPHHKGLRLQRGKPSLYLLDRHLKLHRYVLHGVGLTLLRGLLSGCLEFGLKFREQIRRDFAGLDGLSHAAEEPGFKISIGSEPLAVIVTAFR
jgi:hypothetical protein